MSYPLYPIAITMSCFKSTKLPTCFSRPMCKTFCPCLENSSKLLELVIDIEQPYELLDLPLELFDLAEVEILVIRAVGTWTVPGALRRLVNIKCIFLEVKQLQWLEVYRRSQPLTRIPGSLALDLPAGLFEFSARMCNLLALPPGFACLRSLQVLDISRNKVVNLRPSLSCLTNLMFVDVSYNPFENLTANFPFTSCYQIQALNLDGTGLSGIPWLPNMTSLSHLSLAGNRLKSLPSWFSRLTSLTSLNLSSNRLSMLPHLVSHICNLQVLDVCCNPFLSLCADLRSILTSLCNLRILMLRDTGLSELPRSITALPDLRRLDVGQNDISALPKFGCQRNMLTVHVEGNPMALYPGWMQDRLLRVVFDSDSSTGLVGTPELPRLKLVVLGNTMAGKTSLIRSMQCCKTVLVKEEDRTVALEQFDLVRQSNHVTQFENIGSNVMKSLSRWLSGPDKFVRLLFRVCDCGGQDAYLLTSQMFLSRSMFVIIAADVSEYDCTEETFQRLIGRYLNMVYARAKKAVVLMVLTKVDLLDLRNTSEHSESRPPFGIRRDRRRGLRMVKGKVEHRCVEDRDFEGFEDELLAAITGEQLAGTTGRSVPSQVLEDDDIVCCYESDIFLRANRMQDHRKEQIKEEIRSLQEDTAFSSDPLVQETIADLRYQHEHQPENVRLLTGSSGVDIDRKHNGHTRERKPLEIHQAEFSETFANALSKEGRELVTSPSPDTLKLEETMLGIAQERHTPILSIADVEEALRLANVNSSLDGLRSSVDRLEDEGSIFSCSVSSADGRDQKIFPDIPWLVKVIKAIFRHDHGERLTFVEFKRRYNGPKYVSETEFCSMKYQLIQEGKISSELLHVLWSDLEENHVDNLLQVIIKLNLCCIMPPSRADARGSVLDRLNSGSAVMYIPWLLPDTLPEALVLRADLWRMDQSRSLDCTVSCSYDFRDFVPVGMFEMFMAKLHNSLLGAEEVYMWKTGMLFRYGPIEALIRCVSDISSQVVVMQARIIDLGSNVTRLWHVLYRCILWLEQQLKTTPNVIIRRYLAFQPVVGLRGGPRFDTRYRVLLETGECPNVVVTQLPVDLNRKHMTTLNTGNFYSILAVRDLSLVYRYVFQTLCLPYEMVSIYCSLFLRPVRLHSLTKISGL